MQVARSPLPGSFVFVAGPGDAVWKIPIAATDLHAAPAPAQPPSKLSLAAIRDLLGLAARSRAADDAPAPAEPQDSQRGEP